MSQLTEEQIKALHDAANEYKADIDQIVNFAQKKLKPPPRYEEVFYNACIGAYRHEYKVTFLTFEQLDGVYKGTVSAGLEAAIREFIKREIKPTLEKHIELECLTGAGVLELKQLIERLGG